MRGGGDAAHRGAGLTVVLVFLLLVVRRYLDHPETLSKEVDQRLAEVLLCAIAVQEVPFIWIDLEIHRQVGVTPVNSFQNHLILILFYFTSVVCKSDIKISNKK